MELSLIRSLMDKSSMMNIEVQNVLTDYLVKMLEK